MSDDSQRQDPDERYRNGPERRIMGAEDVSEVEGHLRRTSPERRVLGTEEVPEVEGHIRMSGPEQVAFGTEGAAEAERRAYGIRPEDDPDPADGRRI